MKRRNFLGFLGGAAAAGPKLAAGLSSDVARSAVPMGGFVTNAQNVAEGVASASSGNWRLKRIQEIKDILSGNSSEAARKRKMDRMCAAENIERFRLDGLRSVSATYRAQMLVDGALDRRERIDQLHAQNELDQLLKLPI